MFSLTLTHESSCICKWSVSFSWQIVVQVAQSEKFMHVHCSIIQTRWIVLYYSLTEKYFREMDFNWINRLDGDISVVCGNVLLKKLRTLIKKFKVREIWNQINALWKLCFNSKCHILGISFCTNSDVNFLSNADFVYFVYSYQSGGLTSDHWLTAILFYLLLSYLYKVLVDRKSKILLNSSLNNYVL